MANLNNAKKALRQTAKRTVRNSVLKDELHSLRRYFRQAIEASDKAKAAELAKTLVKKFDKAAQKGVLKQNTAARYKSRMMNKVNSLSK